MDIFKTYGTTKQEILSTLFEVLKEKQEKDGITSTSAERIAYTIGIIDKLDD